MGYRHTESEHGILIKRSTTGNDTDYYKYILVYVDDVIHLAKDIEEDMLKLNHVYRLREVFGPQDRYLGTNSNKVQLEDGRTLWSMTYVEYLRGAIKM